MNFRIKDERNFGYPDEAYANKVNKMLGLLSPSRCLVIQMGGYGPDVLKKYSEANARRIRHLINLRICPKWLWKDWYRYERLQKRTEEPK